MLTASKLSEKNVVDCDPGSLADIIVRFRFTANIFTQHCSQEKMECYEAKFVSDNDVDICEILQGTANDAGFFPQFTRCSRKGCFTKVHMSAREAPETGIWFIFPPY